MDRETLRLVINKATDELQAMGIELPSELKRRDKREPGRDIKERTENLFMRLFFRYLRKQKKALHERLEMRYPNRKDVIIPDPFDGLIDGEADAEFMAELIRLVSVAGVGGVNLFKQRITIGLDYSLINDRALDWARDYAFDLINKKKGGIDAVTRERVSNAIQRFIDTPGFTVGDIMSQLEGTFNLERAKMIAVTETTRAFAEGERIAGEQLQKEFPDVRIVKQWFTNNDDRVCDICGPNDGVEVDFDDTYPSGDLRPPAHVNCRCWEQTRTRI